MPLKMPVLFLGHGSPMNAIEENDFVTGFRTIGKQIPKPDAIVCFFNPHPGTFFTPALCAYVKREE